MFLFARRNKRRRIGVLEIAQATFDVALLIGHFNGEDLADVIVQNPEGIRRHGIELNRFRHVVIPSS